MELTRTQSCSTVAKKFGLTVGRIYQIVQEFHRGYHKEGVINLQSMIRRDQRIFELARTRSYSDVARRTGLSIGRIAHIVHKFQGSDPKRRAARIAHDLQLVNAKWGRVLTRPQAAKFLKLSFWQFEQRRKSTKSLKTLKAGQKMWFRTSDLLKWFERLPAKKNLGFYRTSFWLLDITIPSQTLVRKPSH